MSFETVMIIFCSSKTKIFMVKEQARFSNEWRSIENEWGQFCIPLEIFQNSPTLQLVNANQ